MSFHVPANQATSWAVYWPAIVNEASVSVDEAESFKDKAMKGFDAGEPIWMGALTLKHLVEANRDYRPEKTPLQLAKRVVRF